MKDQFSNTPVTAVQVAAGYVNPSQLSVLSYANYFTLWHYKTPHASVLTPSYFDAVADILRENDMIIATTDMHDAPQTGFYTVLARTPAHAVVTHVNMLGGLDDEGGNASLCPCAHGGAAAASDAAKSSDHMMPHPWQMGDTQMSTDRPLSS